MRSTFQKIFSTYDEAFHYQNRMNMSFKRANNTRDLYCAVPGPEDNYAVVDHRTAVELELGYVFSSSSISSVANPWA
jgi:hypothetical protein